MLRALKRRPEDRYRTGEELAQALDGFLRRHAPTFSAQDLGKFVEKVQTTQPKKRTADEPTAALDLSHAARLSMEARDDEIADRSPSPTMGIDSSQLEQVRALGIKDDNSLLFQSGNLKALLEGKASRKSPPSDDESAQGPSTAKGLRPDDRSDVTTHRRLAGRIYDAAPPQAVFPAITADGEMFGLLTEQADLLPRPRELGQVGSGRRRSSSSDVMATHSQSVAVGDSVSTFEKIEGMAQQLPPDFAGETELRIDVALHAITGAAELQAKQAMKMAAGEAFKARVPKVEADMKGWLEKYAAKSFGKDLKSTASGLQYVVFEAGSGAAVKKSETIGVHYWGCLQSGKKFDDSFSRGEPIEFPVGQGAVIKGWDEGLQLLNHGAKAIFFIPTKLAYDQNSPSPDIPAGADLVFYVEVQ